MMRWRVLLLAVLSTTPAGAFAADAPDPAAPDVYPKHVAPLVAKYCGSCHGDKKQSADLNLTRFADEASVAKDQSAWRKVLTNLQSRDMPPANKPQPTEAERALMATWVDKKLTALGCVKEARNPGRVTMRRLNRAEYNNTIRDLVAVEFRPADDFPSDDVGYGFDNIGDVLSLPPLLMEKYLAAAEQVLDKAVVTADELTPKSEKWPARAWKPSAKFAGEDGRRTLASNGDLSHTHQFVADGEYTLKIKAHGDQAGPEPVRISVQLDGKEVATVDVKASEVGKPETLERKFRVPAGEHKLAVAFVNDFYDEKTKADRNLIVHELQLFGPLNVKLDPPESHRRIFIAVPKTPAEKPAAAEKIVAEFARRAWRRPVTKDEVARLLKLFAKVDAKGEPFEKAISVTLSAVLVSPHFLFRVETERPGGQVSDFELASRLSYFLWSSMPDERLFALAAAGKLRDPATLEAEAKRMLADPKSAALVQNFAGQWLQLRNLRTLTPDRRTYPSFNDALRQAMIRETELFFETVVKEDRDVLEFLDADWTFLNEPLAKHYGIADVKGPEFRRVKLTDGSRGGLLTQASVLTVTSNPTRTSPVKRGKWVLENLLGTPPPPPPPDVPELEEAKGQLTGSLRQRMEQHRQKAVCASCHNRMDPLGFGLENFDGVGGWRAKDGAFAIDATGTLPDGRSFDGPKELKQVLKGRADDFRRCLTEKLLTYALGRGLEYYDKCAVDAVTDALKKRQNKFSVLVFEIVRSEPFRMRRPANKGD